MFFLAELAALPASSAKKNRPKASIRLEIKIEIRLEFNQSEKRKLISRLVNFALIGHNPSQSQSQSLV